MDPLNHASNSDHSRHLAYVKIRGEFLYDMLKTDEPRIIECREGLPEGSKFLRMDKDPMTGCLIAVFEHPSFDLVQEGSLIHQQINPCFYQWYGEAAVEKLSERPKKG